MQYCQYETRKFSRRKGQALVEFALILPFLIVLILGIIEFGWLTKSQLTIANAAREGARAAALGRSTSEITSTIQDQTSGVPGSPGTLTIAMKRDDNDASNGYNYNITLGNAAADSNGVVKNDAPAGAMIQIAVNIPNQALTGFFPIFKNRAISSIVVMRRES